MAASYLLLYRRARKLYDEGKVELTGNKEDVYYFTVDEYIVKLELTKYKHLWQRNWTCSCRGYALFQDRAECAHLKAAEYYLMEKTE